MRETEQIQREEYYTKLYHALPLLKKVVPLSRTLNSRYCRINTENKPDYHGERYKAINVTSWHRHRTFEIRLFNGTLNAEKIISWVSLLKSIMNGRLMKRCPKNFKTAQKHYQLPDSIVAWCEARERRFYPAPVTLNSGQIVNVAQNQIDNEGENSNV
jgi:hypothetical protein